MSRPKGMGGGGDTGGGAIPPSGIVFSPSAMPVMEAAASAGAGAPSTAAIVPAPLGGILLAPVLEDLQRPNRAGLLCFMKKPLLRGPYFTREAFDAATRDYYDLSFFRKNGDRVSRTRVGRRELMALYRMRAETGALVYDEAFRDRATSVYLYRRNEAFRFEDRFKREKRIELLDETDLLHFLEEMGEMGLLAHLYEEKIKEGYDERRAQAAAIDDCFVDVARQVYFGVDNYEVRLYKPRGDVPHNWGANLCWVLGAIHAGKTVELFSPPVLRHVRRPEHPEQFTSFIREITAFRNAGYQIHVEGRGAEQRVSLTPPTDREALRAWMLHDIDPSAADISATLKALHTAMAPESVRVARGLIGQLSHSPLTVAEVGRQLAQARGFIEECGEAEVVRGVPSTPMHISEVDYAEIQISAFVNELNIYIATALRGRSIPLIPQHTPPGAVYSRDEILRTLKAIERAFIPDIVLRANPAYGHKPMASAAGAGAAGGGILGSPPLLPPHLRGQRLPTALPAAASPPLAGCGESMGTGGGGGGTAAPGWTQETASVLRSQASSGVRRDRPEPPPGPSLSL